MASAAVTKYQRENAEIKNRNRARSRRERTKKESLMVTASAVAGSSVSAVASAAVDEKWGASPGDMATFGKSNVPVVPVVGLLQAIAAIPLAKASPSGAAFLGFGGLQMMNIGLYQGARDKIRVMLEKGEDEED